METLLLLIRIILAAVFALAGIGKFLDLKGSEKAVKDFGVPDNLAKPFSVALPVVEIIIAILLLPVATAWLGAISAFLLLLTLIGGMICQMAQGNAPDCHCFGQIHSEPVSAKSLGRNAAFALLAFVLVLQGSQNQGLSIFDSSNNASEGNVMSLILGLTTVGLLAAVVFYLKKISEQQMLIMRQMEVLQLNASEGGKEIEREDLTNPHDGLPIGGSVPDFILPDINGRNVTFENLLMQAKPILFFFVSPACIPCTTLLPEIEAWQNELKEKINFVFISKGQAKENLEKFAGENLKQILLQKDKEVSELFGAQWTPIALLVNTNGTIASRLAVGDKAIRELIEKTKSEIDKTDFLLISNGNGDESRITKLGASLPDFSLTDIYDKNVSSEDLRGKKTLVAFWSLKCAFCEQMLDDLRTWDKTKGADEPNLLLVSEGKVEENRKLDLQSPVVLDEERKISNELGMSGTPSAILVNEDGKIISETAIGAKQIWSLIGKKN
ncbi:MAG: redoxin domain-containing protein [Acidobacteria bacterium]|nr:redoxin domain-containing protein [Acidobacteriota bacterium]